MKKFKNHTLTEYSNVLAGKTPVPGGGSAAALTGALGASLLSMVAHYSRKKDQSRSANVRISKILTQSDKIRKRLLDLVDLDAKAYLEVVKTKKASEKIKKRAEVHARKVPLETCQLCYKAVQLAPDLVKKGNPNLAVDVEVAVELLFSGFNSALILSRDN